MAAGPPHDCRSRGDCGAAAAAEAERVGAASRLPQSRRLRLDAMTRGPKFLDPPHDCRSRGDCGLLRVPGGCDVLHPPHDCRSRGDCGSICALWTDTWKTASRLPQSRRLRPTNNPQNNRRRRRLTIAAVAATAADAAMCDIDRSEPPHDCRSRGDCGQRPKTQKGNDNDRLTIAAVAATAA